MSTQKSRPQYYICDYGNCGASLDSKEMYYVRPPRRGVKRFCSKSHLVAYFQDEKTGNIPASESISETEDAPEEYKGPWTPCGLRGRCSCTSNADCELC